MSVVNENDFKSVLKEYMSKHNIKATDKFFESANSSANIKTRKSSAKA